MAQRSNDGPAESVALTGVDQQAVVGTCVFLGLGVNDDAESNVHLHIHNGTDNTGNFIASSDPSNGGHDELWFGPGGVKCDGGIFVDVITGTPSGSIFYR